MDGSPQLLTNIQFAEAKKGYDRSQVDNFLRELSVKIGELQDMLRQATQRAESAEARAADAAKGRNAAEADVVALRDELDQTKVELESANAAVTAAAAAPAGASGVESATGVLAMAQKTADAAIAEADAKAADTLADATSRAAMVVMEAEQDAVRLKREAIDEADSLRASRVSRMEAEVDKLASQRDGLQTDIDALTAHVEQQRSALRQHAAAISQLVDSPGPLQIPPRPELVGEAPDLARRRTGAVAEERAAQVPNLLEGPAAGSEAGNGIDSGTAVDADGGDPAADAESSADDIGDPAGFATDGPAPGDSEPALTSPDDDDVEASTGVDEATLGISPSASEADTPWADGLGDSSDTSDDEAFAPGGHHSVQPVPEQAGQQAVQSSLIDLTAARLFDDHGAEATQQFDVLADAAPEDAGQAGIVSTGSTPSSPLGEPDAQADEAMRAFFEGEARQSGDETGERRGFLRRK